MKIKVFSRYFPPDFVGGAELSTYYVCKELKKMKNHITINTLSKVKSNEFDIYTLKKPNKIFELHEKLYFEKITKKNILTESDVNWASDFFGAAILKNVNSKKVATVRDYWPLCGCNLCLLSDGSFCSKCNLENIFRCMKIKESSFLRKPIRIIRYLINQKFRSGILSDFDHVVFPSEYLAKLIDSRLHLRDYSIIPNPIPREYCNKVLKEGIFNRILFVGVVGEYKGIKTLIYAMKSISKNDKKIKLTIIGAGDIDKYRNLVKKLGISEQINFTGKIPFNKTIDFYDKADILVVPSLWPEPFGRTIIEGMARKCVVIATNHGGPKEIIEHNKTGFLFEPGNHKELAKIILNLYNEKAKMKTIQKNARKHAINQFQPRKIAKEYNHLFKEIF